MKKLLMLLGAVLIFSGFTFANDVEDELLECQELYETGTPFYWPDRILEETGKKCWDSVEDRFIFVETSKH